MNRWSKLFFSATIPLLIFAADKNNFSNPHTIYSDVGADKKQISDMLDAFHAAAAKADFEEYFNYFTEDAVFIGTDATENWSKKDFMAFSKTYFDRGSAWSFTSLDRHIYFGNNNDIAWFDELLNTQMKICRGSGVVVEQNNEWKVQQYVLSMTIPNSESDEIIKIKTNIEDSIIRSLSGK
ncbi:MAG: nuclear transport factor 2 family protein [Fimbriimonadaceae bacterium]|nr:nuclear transport factor 2 family protein [Chitinophagales bacterium]